MAEHDDLDRYLARARQALVGPAAMRQRVETRLLSLPPAQLAASAPGSGGGWLASGRGWLARRLHPGTVAVLVGLGFGAGFWLGRQPQLEAESNAAASLARGGRGQRATSAAAASPAASSLPSVVTRDTASTEPASVTTAERVPSASAELPATSGPSRSPSTPELSRRSLQHTRSSAVSGSPRAGAAAGSGAAGDDALAAEVAALARVERALRQGEAQLALSLLEELDRKVPVATLGHERTAARVLAECLSPAAREPGSGEARAAQSGAARFLRQHVASLYAERVRSACALEGAGPTSKSTASADTQQSKETQ